MKKSKVIFNSDKKLDIWVCSNCMTENDINDSNCLLCNSPKTLYEQDKSSDSLINTDHKDNKKLNSETFDFKTDQINPDKAVFGKIGDGKIDKKTGVYKNYDNKHTIKVIGICLFIMLAIIIFTLIVLNIININI